LGIKSGLRNGGAVQSLQQAIGMVGSSNRNLLIFQHEGA